MTGNGQRDPAHSEWATARGLYIPPLPALPTRSLLRQNDCCPPVARALPAVARVAHQVLARALPARCPPPFVTLFALPAGKTCRTSRETAILRWQIRQSLEMTNEPWETQNRSRATEATPARQNPRVRCLWV